MKSFLPLIREEWRLLLFGFTMTFGSSLGQTYFIGLFSGEIRDELGLSHGEFGGIYSAATLASALLLLKTGSLIDHLDLRQYAYAVAVGLALGCLLMAGTNGVALLFVAILTLRHLGQGLMSMAGSTTMVRYLDRYRGKASAISGIGYSLSEAILPSLVIALMAILGWRLSWIFWGGALLIAVPLITRFMLHEHTERHDKYLASIGTGQGASDGVASRQWTRAEVLRDSAFYLFLPALLAQPLLFTGFMFHQVHLVEAKAWDLTAWASLYIVYALTSTGCKLIAGVVVDRWGAVRMVPLVCLPLGFGLLAIAMTNQFTAAIVFMCLMGISVGFYSTVSSPFYADMYGTLHLGSIKSVTTFTMVFATAVTPVAMGWMIDAGVSINAMALGGLGYTLAASGLAGVAAFRYIGRTHPPFEGKL